MSRPDLKKIQTLLESNEDFSITEKQYKNSTGASMPKDTYYLKNRSALAKLANEHGFTVEVQERTISLKKRILN